MFSDDGSGADPDCVSVYTITWVKRNRSQQTFFFLKDNRKREAKFENGPNRTRGTRDIVKKVILELLIITGPNWNRFQYFFFPWKVVKIIVDNVKMGQIGWVGPKLWAKKGQIWVPERFFDNISRNMRHTNIVPYILSVYIEKENKHFGKKSYWNWSSESKVMTK